MGESTSRVRTTEHAQKDRASARRRSRSPIALAYNGQGRARIRPRRAIVGSISATKTRRRRCSVSPYVRWRRRVFFLFALFPLACQDPVSRRETRSPLQSPVEIQLPAPSGDTTGLQDYNNLVNALNAQPRGAAANLWVVEGRLLRDA